MKVCDLSKYFVLHLDTHIDCNHNFNFYVLTECESLGWSAVMLDNHIHCKKLFTPSGIESIWNSKTDKVSSWLSHLLQSVWGSIYIYICFEDSYWVKAWRCRIFLVRNVIMIATNVNIKLQLMSDFFTKSFFQFEWSNIAFK